MPADRLAPAISDWQAEPAGRPEEVPVPAALVHGVPETSAVWDPLCARVQRRDVVALSLPGFGRARPEGFGATKDDYMTWLVDELEGQQGPVDLVGHDWGGGFVVRLVSTRPDLVRSWVTDAASFGSADFKWHEFAKIWQTPGAGEEFFDGMLAQAADQRAGLLEQFAVPHDDALAMAAALDRTMVESILPLYRSALDVGREWAPAFHQIPAPGLVLLPSEDPFQSTAMARGAAGQAGAEVAELPGLGHWWMLQDPARGANVLEAFWATIG